MCAQTYGLFCSIYGQQFWNVAKKLATFGIFCVKTYTDECIFWKFLFIRTKGEFVAEWVMEANSRWSILLRLRRKNCWKYCKLILVFFSPICKMYFLCWAKNTWSWLFLQKKIEFHLIYVNCDFIFSFIRNRECKICRFWCAKYTMT